MGRRPGLLPDGRTGSSWRPLAIFSRSGAPVAPLRAPAAPLSVSPTPPRFSSAARRASDALALRRSTAVRCAAPPFDAAKSTPRGRISGRARPAPPLHSRTSPTALRKAPADRKRARRPQIVVPTRPSDSQKDDVDAQQVHRHRLVRQRRGAQPERHAGPAALELDADRRRPTSHPHHASSRAQAPARQDQGHDLGELPARRSACPPRASPAARS